VERHAKGDQTESLQIGTSPRPENDTPRAHTPTKLNRNPKSEILEIGSKERDISISDGWTDHASRRNEIRRLHFHKERRKPSRSATIAIKGRVAAMIESLPELAKPHGRIKRAENQTTTFSASTRGERRATSHGHTENSGRASGRSDTEQKDHWRLTEQYSAIT
jgi:hypothetical protein